MAKQVIILGTAANDGTGTTLRTGGDMINDNFTELYDQVTVGKKIYKVLLNQLGIVDPTALVLVNTLGTVTLSKIGIGNYALNSIGLFTANKTFITNISYYNFDTLVSIALTYNNQNEITVQTFENGDLADQLLINYPISIEVYP